MADSKKNARYTESQNWLVAGTDSVLGYDDCYDSGTSMLLEMKGSIDINDIYKSGSENRPLTHVTYSLWTFRFLKVDVVLR